MPQPPPLPARATPASVRAPSIAPLPSDEGTMSTRDKMSLADAALELRDEQVRARVVLYKADLETSPELDAITAQVVAELRGTPQAVQGAAKGVPVPPVDRAQLEIELISAFKELLAGLFRAGELSGVIGRQIAQASKRFAKLFFESELCDRLQGSTGEQKTMRQPAQALYHVLARNEAFLTQQLEAFEYASPRDLADAKARLAATTKDLRNEFLSSTTPELNALVRHLTEVLVELFTVELPPTVGELAWEVVKEGRLADAEGGSQRGARSRLGPTIRVAAFSRFRATFEKKFLHRLVAYVEDEMLKRVRGKENEFRSETLRFVADPQIFSDVCELVCEAIYEYLYQDGFLDLPPDWRVQTGAAG